ncbi:MAG TPA: FlgO family outer membrane protein [Armatimonadota bacterium]
MKFTVSFRLLLAVIAFVVCALPLPLLAAPQTKTLDHNVSGSWNYQNSTCTIGGVVYDGWGRGSEMFASFDVRGWDHFTANIGINDNYRWVTAPQRTVIEVDGDQVWQQDIAYGEKAQFVDIPLTGKRTLTLRYKASYTLFAEPKLVKGNPVAQFACPICTTTFNTQVEWNGHINTAHAVARPATIATPPAVMQTAVTGFVVDPNDLDKLATNLRKRVDAKPAVQQKLAQELMAVMTFNLIDISSPSVAQNVAEDLSTRLINADFNLVERGQLDKALKEMKIQDSALIDQSTAQRLGQIAGCKFILVGSVSDRGKFLVINTRILETATGKAVAAESVECRKNEL